jgi:hypothetical protein
MRQAAGVDHIRSAYFGVALVAICLQQTIEIAQPLESMQSCGQVMRLRLLPLEWESVESRDAKGGMHLRGFR